MAHPDVTADTVVAERTGAVGYAYLNRPYALNAVTVQLAEALERTLRDLADEVSVIVVRGMGGHFSVGGDFKEVERLRSEGHDALRELFESFGAACALIADLPVPVIAAVEGYALAGGFELMQACDLSVVCRDARIGDNHVRFGQVPGGGGSQRLPRLVGRQRALGLMLTGDHLSGDEAVAWGLAYRAFAADSFDAEVGQFAEQLAEKSPAALVAIKRLVRDGLDRPLADGLTREISVVLGHLASSTAGAWIERFDAQTRKGGI